MLFLEPTYQEFAGVIVVTRFAPTRYQAPTASAASRSTRSPAARLGGSSTMWRGGAELTPSQYPVLGMLAGARDFSS